MRHEFTDAPFFSAQWLDSSWHRGGGDGHRLASRRRILFTYCRWLRSATGRYSIRLDSACLRSLLPAVSASAHDFEAHKPRADGSRLVLGARRGDVLLASLPLPRMRA